MKQFVVFLATALLLIACKKDSSNTDRVLIRIENATAENFDSFTLNATEFGSIPNGDTSTYYNCKDVLPYPFANLVIINNKHTYIMDIVPMPYMANGKYLMKVMTDTLPWHYKASFIKE